MTEPIGSNGSGENPPVDGREGTIVVPGNGNPPLANPATPSLAHPDVLVGIPPLTVTNAGETVQHGRPGMNETLPVPSVGEDRSSPESPRHGALSETLPDNLINADALDKTLVQQPFETLLDQNRPARNTPIHGSLEETLHDNLINADALDKTLVQQPFETLIDRNQPTKKPIPEASGRQPLADTLPEPGILPPINDATVVEPPSQPVVSGEPPKRHIREKSHPPDRTWLLQQQGQQRFDPEETGAHGTEGNHQPASDPTDALTADQPSGTGTKTLPILTGNRQNQNTQDNYEIIKRLGKGAMGIVYLARQKTIGRLVALKKIIDKSSGDTRILGMTLARFRKEAEALGKIQHPNIIQVFDYGVGSDSMPFFATEYCPGGALSDAIKNKQVEPRQAARLMVTMVRAMAAAHQAGIVHRDLKPHNVLLDRPCEEINSFDPGGLKIADFGLVRDTAQTDDARYTQEYQPMGTWLYMAPEQMVNAAEAGALADTYSLGVMLYEMITGRLPLVANNQREMIRLIEEVDPQPIQTFAPSCPKDLETICLKCLRKDPAKRYPSANAFADDLVAFLEYRPVSARPVGKVERAIKWIRRNPGLAVGGLSSVLLVVLVLVSTIFFSIMRVRQERDLRQKDNERAALEIEQVEKEAAIRQEAEAKKTAAQSQERASAIVASLLGNAVSPDAVPGLLDRFDKELEYALPLLDLQIGTNEKASGLERSMLAALPYRARYLESVAANALSAQPGEIPAYASRLSATSETLRAQFWKKLGDKATPNAVRLRLASILAIWSPDHEEWPKDCELISEALVGLDILELNPWLSRLSSIETHLLPHLEKVFRESRTPSPSQSSLARADTAARIISTLRSSDPHLLARCVVASNDSQFDILSSRIRTDSAEVCRILDEFTCTDPATGLLGNFLASIVPMEIGPDMIQTRTRISKRSEKCRELSRALCCLAFLGKPERLWEALERIDIPDLFSEIVHLAPSTRIPLSLLVNRLPVEKRPKTKRSIILMLGFYPPEDVMRAGGEKLVGDLMDNCANNPDPGVHAAALWLLSWRLGRSNEIVAALSHGKTTQVPPSNRLSWRINGQGQRMVGIPSGSGFMMGSGPDDPDKVIQLGHDIEKAHKVMIGHSFEIGLQEVTVAQYQKFKKDYRPFDGTDSNEPADRGLLPATGISWFDAMDYCKWLSEQEKTKPEQIIMQSVDIRPNCRLEADFTGKTGYRLPTEEEWELVSRAGCTTPYPSGYSPRRLNDHAWTWENSGGNAKPSGKLLPNPWGISDASGNALEWVMDDFKLYKSDSEISKTSAGLPFFVIPGDSLRVVRGGSFSNAPEAARFSSRLMSRADQRASSIGFRVCRTTIPANPKTK